MLFALPRACLGSCLHYHWDEYTSRHPKCRVPPFFHASRAQIGRAAPARGCYASLPPRPTWHGGPASVRANGHAPIFTRQLHRGRDDYGYKKVRGEPTRFARWIRPVARRTFADAHRQRNYPFTAQHEDTLPTQRRSEETSACIAAAGSNHIAT